MFNLGVLFIARPSKFSVMIILWINPTSYLDEAKDVEQDFKNRHRRLGTLGQSLLANMEMINAQYDVENQWFDEHESSSARMSDMLAAGFNPLSAGRAILGSPTVDTTAPSAQTVSQDPTSELQVLNGIASNLNGASNAMVNASVAKAQIDNLNAQSAMYDTQSAVNAATAPTIAPESASRVYKNTAEGASAEADVPVKEAQVGVLNAQQTEIISKADLNDKEREQIAQVMSRYDEVTDAQINNWTAQTALYWEQRNTEKHKQYELDASSLLLGAQTSESYQRSANLATEQEGQAIQNALDMNVAEFVASTGIPMNASDLQTVQYYESRGQYDKAKSYMMTIFDCAAARESGVQKVQVQSDAYKAHNRAAAENYFRDSSSLRGYFIKGVNDFGHRVDGDYKYQFYNPKW